MVKVPLYPLRFEPIYKNTIWGGDKILALKGMQPNGENLGESWEVSGVQDNVSVVADGYLKGTSLTELIQKYKEIFVGETVYQRYGNQFPLLFKFIDAHDDLSVQVHPDDEMARKHRQSNGKTEFWYVIDAEEGSSLYAGLKKNCSPEELRTAVESDEVCELLNKEEVVAGDAFFLPAGRVHAIGAGLLIAEIQQTSDATYRLFDYNRVDKNGNPRELHLDKALESIDYKVYRNYKTTYNKNRTCKPIQLKECGYFTINLLTADTFVKFDYKGLDSFVAFMCVEGSAVFTSQRKFNGKINKGETILFPACDLPVALIPENDKVKLLEVYVK